jgi:hypothetical protein
MVTDLAAATTELTRVVGSSGLDFEARWAELEARTADAEPGERAAAVGRLLDDLADDAGGPTGRRLRDLARSAPAAMVVARAEAPAAPEPPRRRSWWRRRPDRGPDPVPVAEEATAAESEIADAAREILATRARAQASITRLSLELHSMSARGG